MSDGTVTFEKVDAALRRANLAPFKPGGRHHFTRRDVVRNPADVIKKICAAWKIARPILMWLKPILPRKWREAIETFTKLMNTLCQSPR